MERVTSHCPKDVEPKFLAKDRGDDQVLAATRGELIETSLQHLAHTLGYGSASRATFADVPGL